METFSFFFVSFLSLEGPNLISGGCFSRILKSFLVLESREILFPRPFRDCPKLKSYFSSLNVIYYYLFNSIVVAGFSAFVVYSWLRDILSTRKYYYCHYPAKEDELLFLMFVDFLLLLSLNKRWTIHIDHSKWNEHFVIFIAAPRRFNWIYTVVNVSCTVSWKRKHHPPSKKQKNKKWNGQIDFRMASMFQRHEELNNHLMVSSRDITNIEHHSMMNECDAPLPVQLIKDLHGWQLL